MKFQAYKTESKSRGIGGNGYFQLQDGENKFRVLSEPEGFSQHFLGAGTKPAICIGDNCEYCQGGNRKSNKIMMYIVDRSDEKVKLATLPWSIYNQLGGLAESSDWGFKDLPPYDLIVTRSGKGLDTEYNVAPSRNETPVTPDQLEEFMKKKSVFQILESMKASEAVPPPEPTEFTPDID